MRRGNDSNRCAFCGGPCDGDGGYRFCSQACHDKFDARAKEIARAEAMPAQVCKCGHGRAVHVSPIVGGCMGCAKGPSWCSGYEPSVTCVYGDMSHLREERARFLGVIGQRAWMLAFGVARRYPLAKSRAAGVLLSLKSSR